MSNSRSSESHDPRLDRILAEYVESAESGTPQNSDDWAARYPEFAAELREFISVRRQLGEAVRNAADELSASAFDAPTFLGQIGDRDESLGSPNPPRVRYFGDYELLEEIARGGMGVVYKARQVNLKRIVALKMILSGQLAGEEDVRRFHAEAEAAAKLDHPNIVPIFEIGQQQGQHYFSMALVEGESLGHALARGIFAPRAAAEMTKKIAEAIAYAHVQGVIHRDLKPANVLVDKDGQPRVTDFGLAKRIEPGDAVSQHTATGQILGTPSYMPPEQASGETARIGIHSDIYSIGAILYCLLTGRPPFQAATPLDTVMQVIQQEPVPPRQLNAAIPRDLETITLKCLEKDPHQRYSSARELAEELDRFLKGEPIHARSVSRIERGWRWCRRNPVVAGLTASLLLALVSGSVISGILAVRAERAASVSAGLAEKSSASERLTRRYLYSAHMNLANEAWKSGNVLRTVELLNQHRPKAEDEDLRSFEWGYLWQQCNRQQKTIALTTGEQVGSVAVSPDGRWIAVGTFSGSTFAMNGEDVSLNEIRLWNVTDGTLRETIRGKIDSVFKEPDEQYLEMVFSPDGKLFAIVAFNFDMEPGSGGRKPTNPRIMIRDTETMKIQATIPLTTFQLRDRIAISPDNLRVPAGTTTAWDPAQKDKKPVHDVTIRDIPERADAAVGDAIPIRQREINMWSDVGMPCFKFTSDGKSLLWGRLADPVTVTNVSGDGPDTTYDVSPWGVQVSPDGKYLTSWQGAVVKLLDAKTGMEIHTFPAGAAPGNTPPTRFSPDGRILAVTRGLSVDLWDLESKQQIGEIRGQNDYPRAVGFGADGKTVITVANNKITNVYEAKVWDVTMRPGPDEIHLASNRPRMLHPLQHKEIDQTPAGVFFSPHGDILASLWGWWQGDADQSRALILQDLAAGSLGKQIVHRKWNWLDAANDTPKQFSPQGVSISPDGKWMALSGAGLHEDATTKEIRREQFVQLWPISQVPSETGASFERILFAPQHNSNTIARVVFTPDGAKLAFPRREFNGSSIGPDFLQVLDLASGVSSRFPANPEAWFPHAQGLLGNFAGSAWNGSCNGIVFTSDGKRILSVHKTYILPWETRVVVWDAATGEVLAVLESPGPLGYGTQSFALSRDDGTVATSQQDNSIYLWDVSESRLRDVNVELKQRAEAAIERDHKKPVEPAGKPRAILRGHADVILAMAFHPDGKTLASSSNDGNIRIWDTATGELRLNLDAHAATTLTFTPDGNTLISADPSGIVKLWHSLTGERTMKSTAHAEVKHVE
ncbi:MAG: WD40 repeat domain-containing serine/threonine-protein kinase [Planctomycetota bacterium]|nr:WD40 repeat domain-containing serine/threonine-protein kinase [Planctomycetota bacterium]